MELERKKIMSHDDRHRPLLVTNGGDDGGGSGGPTTLNDSGANEVGRRSTPHSPKNTIVFKSPGGDMAAAAAALGFPFTAAQWKELERQAMIYKYMVASLPVPSDLLINFPDPTNLLGNGSLYSLRYPNKDVEPERCKRTDGKKWRCSRDVAPHKKYCERHMHRGRPRSRKPVEVHPSIDSTNYNIKKTRLNQTPPLQTNPTTQPFNHSSTNISSSFLGTAGQPKDPQNISKSFYKEPNRVNLGWMMDGEIVATNGVEQQWLHLMENNNKSGLSADQRQSGYGTNDSIFHHGFGEQPLNLFSYPDHLPQEEDMFRSNNDFFLNSDPISLKLPPMEDYPISRGFIDAWSSGNLEAINNEPSISSSQGNLSPSSLNLSIAMAADSGHQEPKDCPISWVSFSPGGPLAEVLQPGYIANAGDSISPPATAVSSPSGVLQRALFSQSDGSVCNSPTMALSAAAPPAQEVVAFQWFS